MKIIYCNRCSKRLGYIEKGSKILPGIVWLCSECNQRAKIAEDMIRQDLSGEMTDNFITSLFGKKK